MNNSFGKSFSISIYGGSHEPCVGIRIDGVPSGLRISRKAFEAALSRRRPGAKGTTPRVEEDFPHFVSGVVVDAQSIAATQAFADAQSISATQAFADAQSISAAQSFADSQEFVTNGNQIVMEFPNKNIRPADYDNFRDMPRPGHADFVARLLPPTTGGSFFSGRMTVALVAAGVVAASYIRTKIPSYRVDSRLTAVGGSRDEAQWQGLVDAALKDGDSLGGIVETEASGLPVGLGEPFFDSVESLISHLVFSVPGVRGIEFGDGFKASSMRGSEHNDPFGPDGILLKNGAGGVNGGFTNGAPILFRTAFKPTSTISKPQNTWNFATNSMDSLSARGRHDCCFALRTPVILESVTSLVIADLIAQSSLF